MPATTPSGCRMEYMSMPGPALSVNSPFKRWGAPMANSTTSRPRWMSPMLSATILPCSEERSSASGGISFADDLQELHHDPGALLWILGGPGRLGGFRIGDNLRDLGFAGERRPRLHFASVRRVNVREPSGLSLDCLAADKMTDMAHDALRDEVHCSSRKSRAGAFRIQSALTTKRAGEPALEERICKKSYLKLVSP